MNGEHMTKHVTLNVSGDAELAVVADYATVSVSTEVNKPTRETATQAIQPLLDRLRAALVNQPDARNASISRLRVTHETRWDRKREEHVDAGWDARVSGSAEVVAADLKSVTARVLAADAEISNIHWQLDADNVGYRTVRKAAVHVARTAAEDFADALNKELGPLLVLSDAGLSGPQVQSNPFLDEIGSAPTGSAPDGDDNELILDPPMITIGAEVEATYLTA